LFSAILAPMDYARVGVDFKVIAADGFVARSGRNLKSPSEH
jgi:hypothetical protein